MFDRPRPRPVNARRRGHVRQPKDRTSPDILQFHRVDASVSASDGASALLSRSAFEIFPDVGTSHRIPRNVCTAARGVFNLWADREWVPRWAFPRKISKFKTKSPMYQKGSKSFSRTKFWGAQLCTQRWLRWRASSDLRERKAKVSIGFQILHAE